MSGLLCGVLFAPIAGKIADRRGPHTVIGLGSVIMLTSWVENSFLRSPVAPLLVFAVSTMSAAACFAGQKRLTLTVIFFLMAIVGAPLLPEFRDGRRISMIERE